MNRVAPIQDDERDLLGLRAARLSDLERAVALALESLLSLSGPEAIAAAKIHLMSIQPPASWDN